MMKYGEYIKEALHLPYEEGEILSYNDYYLNNLNAFKDELINDLKNKLVGKEIVIDGKYIPDYRNIRYRDADGRWMTKEDPFQKDHYVVDGKKVKRLFKIKVKDVKWEGSHQREIYYMSVVDDEGHEFRLKKICTDKQWKTFAKKVDKYIQAEEEAKRKKEQLRLKHIHHDPFGEEAWDEDD